MFGGHIKVTSGKYSFERMHYIKEEGFMARMNVKRLIIFKLYLNNSIPLFVILPTKTGSP